MVVGVGLDLFFEATLILPVHPFLVLAIHSMHADERFQCVFKMQKYHLLFCNLECRF